MNIIITMAGDGTRFKNKGIDQKEKWELEIKNKTMFEWSISSLGNFFDEKFIFIAREDHNPRNFIEQKCGNLGIENWELLEISDKTDGQASTALLAEEALEGDEVAIYNIDTFIEGNSIEKDQLNGKGCIPVFEASGDQWSFVKTEKGEVKEIAEKERISDLASIGFYYFESFEEFKESYSNCSRDIKKKYGEVYVAPLYNWFLKNDLEVTIQKIEADNVHILGTPQDIIEFWPGFKSKHNLSI